MCRAFSAPFVEQARGLIKPVTLPHFGGHAVDRSHRLQDRRRGVVSELRYDPARLPGHGLMGFIPFTRPGRFQGGGDRRRHSSSPLSADRGSYQSALKKAISRRRVRPTHQPWRLRYALQVFAPWQSILRN